MRTEDVLVEEVRVPEGRRELRGVDKLTESIREVGLLNPITVTEDRRLVAGYHRLEACRALGWKSVPAVVVSLSELDLTLAELDENLVRSELTALERMVLMARRKEIYEAKYPEAKRPKGGRRKRGNGEKISPFSFSEDTARKAGVTRRTVQQEVQIATRLMPDAVRALWGTSAAEKKSELAKLARLEPALQLKVAREIGGRRAKTVKEAVRKLARRDELGSMGSYMPAPGRYQVIVADPPWPNGSAGSAPCPAMSIEEIRAEEVPADEDCLLFLWVRNDSLREAFSVLDAWGFEEKTILTWVRKRAVGGPLLREQTEQCIIALKGEPRLELGEQTTVLWADASEGGGKPEKFYELVEEICPEASRLEMFSRSGREGWVSAGPEEPAPAEDRVAGG